MHLRCGELNPSGPYLDQPSCVTGVESTLRARWPADCPTIDGNVIMQCENHLMYRTCGPPWIESPECGPVQLCRAASDAGQDSSADGAADSTADVPDATRVDGSGDAIDATPADAGSDADATGLDAMPTTDVPDASDTGGSMDASRDGG